MENRTFTPCSIIKKTNGGIKFQIANKLIYEQVHNLQSFYEIAVMLNSFLHGPDLH